MVDIIKTVLRIAFLAAAYALIIAALTNTLPDIVVALGLIDISPEILAALSSGISILSWIYSPQVVQVAFYGWLSFPLIKLVIYFMFKAYSLGDLSPLAASPHNPSPGKSSAKASKKH